MKPYANNKKELLAIVWALKNLRNYLYGVVGIEIHTDHQPLAYSISDKNPNIEMKRWYSFIQSFTPTSKYQPGTTNVVADALLRIQINNLTETDLSDNGSEDNKIHSVESSFENVIKETKKPLKRHIQ